MCHRRKSIFDAFLTTILVADDLKLCVRKIYEPHHFLSKHTDGNVMLNDHTVMPKKPNAPGVFSSNAQAEPPTRLALPETGLIRGRPKAAATKTWSRPRVGVAAQKPELRENLEQGTAPHRVYYSGANRNANCQFNSTDTARRMKFVFFCTHLLLGVDI